MPDRTLVPDFAGYLKLWAPLHGDYLPPRGSLTGRWLRLAYAAARPLAARGVRPGAVTHAGVLVSLAVPLAGFPGGRRPLLAVGVDRVSDAAYLLPLWLLGAPGWVCAAGGFLMLLQEYARARAGNAGMGEIGVVTVWERPTRVILTAFLLLGCGLVTAWTEGIALGGAIAWTAFGLVGLTQLLVSVHRALRD